MVRRQSDDAATRRLTIQDRESAAETPGVDSRPLSVKLESHGTVGARPRIGQLALAPYHFRPLT
jgi:hypothetical protein